MTLIVWPIRDSGCSLRVAVTTMVSGLSSAKAALDRKMAETAISLAV
jgi:hypothetical protein